MAGQRFWVVRAGNDNEIAEDVEREKYIALGWGDLGYIGHLGEGEDIRNRLLRKRPDLRPKSKSEALSIGQIVGYIDRFVNDIKIGDTVLTPVKATRQILIGEVSGDYRHSTEVISDEYPHVREVIWKKKVRRDALKKAKASLRSQLTVFEVTKHAKEINQVLRRREGTVRDESSNAEPSEDEELLRRDPQVEKRAMKAALAFERGKGRKPKDVSEHKLGYDIRSSRGKVVRYIEVKGCATSHAVFLTPNEWRKAEEELPDEYWLYVIRNCSTKPRVIPIENPAKRFKDAEKLIYRKITVDMIEREEVGAKG